MGWNPKCERQTVLLEKRIRGLRVSPWSKLSDSATVTHNQTGAAGLKSEDCLMIDSGINPLLKDLNTIRCWLISNNSSSNSYDNISIYSRTFIRNHQNSVTI
jgi:hypothetical protein